MIVKLKRENKIIDKGEESMTRVAQDTDTADTADTGGCGVQCYSDCHSKQKALCYSLQHIHTSQFRKFW